MWHMDVNYLDLNRACPKDAHHMHHIDKSLNIYLGFELLSFMDAYVGYNKIHMDLNKSSKKNYDSEKVIYATQ